MKLIKKFWDSTIRITLTWSKFMAFLILVASVMLDWKNGGAMVTMFSMPFITFLITGKQFIDKNKPENIEVEIKE